MDFGLVCRVNNARVTLENKLGRGSAPSFAPTVIIANTKECPCKWLSETVDDISTWKVNALGISTESKH